jgi:hypothetical protein
MRKYGCETGNREQGTEKTRSPDWFDSASLQADYRQSGKVGSDVPTNTSD